MLDDAGQYQPQTGPGWWLVPVGKRFRTLGEKRNACAGLVSPDVDAFTVWDDDDIYLPWHLEAAVAARRDADYTIPILIYTDKRDRLELKANEYLFHGAWTFRREAFERVCGYPFMQRSQDRGLRRRFKDAKLRWADPIQHDPRPSYVYRWYTVINRHISAMGKDGYERLGQVQVTPLVELASGWDRDWVGLHEEASRAQKAGENAPAMRRTRV